MTPSSWVAVLGFALVCLTTLVGVLFWLFTVHTTAQDAKRENAEFRVAQAKAWADLHAEREKDKESFGKRLDSAEAAARAFDGLAKSIEHLADKFTTEMKHMAERSADHNRFVTEQLTDIKNEQKNLHQKVEAVPVARSTGRRPRAANAN